MRKKTVERLRLLSLSLSISLAGTVPGAVLQEFRVTDYLGRSWSDELVFFKLDTETSGTASNANLRRKGGAPIPHQVTKTPDGHPGIAFKVDLPPFETGIYHLTTDGPAVPTESTLQIERLPDRLRILSGKIGLEVASESGPYTNGPLMRVQMQSGLWIGSGRLQTSRTITDYRVAIEAGPVFADITCLTTFDNDKTWHIRFRVIAGEPVIIIDESFDLGDRSRWEWSPGIDFVPTHAVTQSKDGHAFRPLRYTRGAMPLRLTAWIPWWIESYVAHVGLFWIKEGALITERPGSVPLIVRPPDMPDAGLSGSGPPLRDRAATDRALTVLDDLVTELEDLFKDEVSAEASAGASGEGGRLSSLDYLTFAAGRGSRWADEGDDGQGKFIGLQTDPDHGLILRCPLNRPGRHWSLGAFLTDNSLTASDAISPSQAMLIKYCDIPLNDVKDMVLEWNSDTPIVYPNLIATRAAFAERPTIRNRPSDSVSTPPPDTVTRNARELLQPALQVFTGAANQAASNTHTIHRCELIMALTLYADLMLGSDVLTQAEIHRVVMQQAILARRIVMDKRPLSEFDKRIVRAQLAFLAYKLARPDYYSVARNYRANPNMTTARYTATALIACLIADHPRASEWADKGMLEIDRQLREWVGPNGGWIEAPHYQTVSMGVILLAAYAAYNAGIADFLHDERLLRTVLYLAKLSTPPDPRFDNRRHFPPVGNTYQMETSVLFGLLARIHRDRDPGTADALQWIWREQGKPMHFGVGGGVAFEPEFYGGLVDHDYIPPQPPDWRSELFPAFGAVLRGGFPGDRETYMCFKSGWTYEHYDFDNGSFEMWGKGRPLCLDWGYQSRQPDWEHNRIEGGNHGRITAFAPLEHADYIFSDNGSWNRAILFVKDLDPLGPTYFVLNDAVVSRPSNWWLWNYTDRHLRLESGVVRVSGKDDVDLDIWFPSAVTAALPRLDAARAAAEDAAMPPTVGGPVLDSSVLSSRIEALTRPGRGAAELSVMEDEWRDLMSDQPVVPVSESGVPVEYVATRRHTQECFDARFHKLTPLTQRGLSLPVNKEAPLFSVLYPRLKAQPVACFTSIANGNGVRITSPEGIDYAFLAREPIYFNDGPIAFEGTAGVIQIRSHTVTLTINHGRRIAYGEHELISDGPAMRRLALSSIRRD